MISNVTEPYGRFLLCPCHSPQIILHNFHISVFEKNFVADIIEDSNLRENTLLPSEALFGLNNESESAIAINLVPLAEKQLNKSSQQKDRLVI